MNKQRRDELCSFLNKHRSQKNELCKIYKIFPFVDLLTTQLGFDIDSFIADNKVRQLS